MAQTQPVNELEQQARSVLIRDLVEQYPAAMPVLSEYGMDVCCGGSLTVPAAAEAHGHDPELVVQRVLGVMREGES